ncbi:MAG: hypothetical protein V4519_03275 [Patescibacteria group bacterium]
MITEQDITKLKDTFVTKDEFYNELYPIKNDISNLKEDMITVKENTQQILTILDTIVKKQDEAEIVALKFNQERHDRQIKYLADKTGNTLPD